MLILLIFLSTPISNRSRPRANYPWFSAEKLGPQGTIAKENGERKEKSQKRPEKCKFFVDMWKSPLKQRLECREGRNECHFEPFVGQTMTGSVVA
jgi:hypothetical protein